MVHLSFSFSLIVGDGAPVANAVVLSVVVAAGGGGDADEDHMKKWAHETESMVYPKRSRRGGGWEGDRE
jgi:hypothetical protein